MLNVLLEAKLFSSFIDFKMMFIKTTRTIIPKIFFNLFIFFFCKINLFDFFRLIFNFFLTEHLIFINCKG